MVAGGVTRRGLLLIWLFAILPVMAIAQGAERQYPEYASLSVNDYAAILPAEDAAALAARLDTLREDRGIEMVVVTAASRSDYGDHGSLERFATGLFNTWGIGNATRNDGILILVLTRDREMRIELGRGYDRDWDWVAQGIIDQTMVPAFRQGDFVTGLRDGVEQTIDRIALAHAGGATAPPPSEPGGISGGIVALTMAVLGLGLVMRRRIGDALYRLRRCPQCGARGLVRTRETLMAATRQSPGRGRQILNCANCDYRDESSYRIARIRTSSSSSSFGGGSSSGGGASGRW